MDPSHFHRIGGGGDRFPQWGVQETRDLLMIRAELDQTFMETKRNKLLWEVISTKMNERGYNRSPEQCKCKWKNLVARYKGCETMEEGMKQQIPFYNELQAIFTTRMQRMLWNESNGVASGSKKRMMQFSSDDEDDNKQKKKVTKSSSTICNDLKEMLEEFMKQQMDMEMQWMKRYEAKEEERRMKEMEWRKTMEALEKERMMLERRWREREQQRMMREEARAQKKDALINTLLSKLKKDDL